MQAKVQAMKKNAGKKNKKEIHTEIEKLENQIESRHLEELKNLTLTDSAEPEVTTTSSTPEPPTDEPQRISKAQRRREKKSEKDRERQEQIDKESASLKDGPREQEMLRIRELLAARKLAVFPIAADGDCLYGAVSHQLKQTGRTAMNVHELRDITANYIAANKSKLLPYMTNPETNEGLNEGAEFEEYCEKLRSTKCWGGQVEIMALSNALKVPIEVLQAHGPPTVQSAGEYQAPNLVLTYHRHFVSLGEHYNSTLKATENEDEV